MNNMESNRGRRKIRRGKVTSDRMDKTIVVEVVRKFRHPLYKKVVKQTARFHAHDEENGAHIGDLVEIMETRPISKQKRWRLVSVVRKGAESRAENTVSSDAGEEETA